MQLQVIPTDEGHRLRRTDGTTNVADVELVNGFLAHLVARCFSPATVRAYAYDLLNFLRFLVERRATLADVVATYLFDYLDWQQRPPATVGARVVRLAERRGAAPASMNRRVAAVRGLFEYGVISGLRGGQPRSGRAPLQRATREAPRCPRPHQSEPAERRGSSGPAAAPAAGVVGPR